MAKKPKKRPSPKPIAPSYVEPAKKINSTSDKKRMK